MGVEPSSASDSAFSLQTLMLTITLIGVCLGVMTFAPGLGVLLAILVAPAMVRTLCVASRRRRSGAEISGGDKATVFMASLGAVITAMVAASAVFAGTCIATCFGVVGLAEAGVTSPSSESIFLVVLSISSLLGIATAVLVLRLFWKSK
jgi:hypothetical protein